jgi:glycosyltransferase involved in cell wall biosynthesis
MTNVLFINYWNFESNSSVHIFNLANRLVRCGLQCAVAVPNAKSTIGILGEAKFTACEFNELNASSSPFKDGQGPDLIHAWTPREIVRRETERLAWNYGCPYVVHLEDNEEFLFEAYTHISLAEQRRMSIEELDERAGEKLSHPFRYRRFLEGAAGVTVIIDSLFAFKPGNLPGEEISPGYDEDLFYPQDGDHSLRKSLGILDHDYVLVYTGNVHPANVREVRSLYSAVGLVNRQGYGLKLVRSGRDDFEVLEDGLQFISQHIIDVGFLSRAEIPRYLALADFLVQPGRAGTFNDFRIPSKLPEFLAMGRPVVLPKTNIGRRIRHEIDGLVMEEGHSLDIARQLCRLIGDPGLRHRLGPAARAFAETQLNWNTSARKLLGFYERILGRRVIESGQQQQLKPETAALSAAVEASLLRRHYAEFAVPVLGYATVADYVDSLEYLPELARINHDIKDVQRPWMLKALLAKVPPGGRLLEIGGGDPWVAGRLVDLGYTVSIVDPYEGCAHGPTEFEEICKAHPDVTFIRGLFPEAMPAASEISFDAIYSISVLEHVPIERIRQLFEGIKRFLRHDRCPTIHAIDHVHRGRGSESHFAMLRRVADAAGLPISRLDELPRRLEDDPEVYFLSAEAHNLWRGSMPYPEFPMRRVVSVHICVPGHMIPVARLSPPAEP